MDRKIYSPLNGARISSQMTCKKATYIRISTFRDGGKDVFKTHTGFKNIFSNKAFNFLGNFLEISLELYVL